MVEPFDGADQPDRPLLDEIGERDAGASVAAGDGFHKPQVALDHHPLGVRVAALDAPGEDYLVGLRARIEFEVVDPIRPSPTHGGDVHWR
jgi:hypothetical protein